MEIFIAPCCTDTAVSNLLPKSCYLTRLQHCKSTKVTLQALGLKATKEPGQTTNLHRFQLQVLSEANLATARCWKSAAPANLTMLQHCTGAHAALTLQVSNCCQQSCYLARLQPCKSTSLSLEGVSQMVYILPERLPALVRPAFDLVLRRIRSLKRCVQA